MPSVDVTAEQAAPPTVTKAKRATTANVLIGPVPFRLGFMPGRVNIPYNINSRLHDEWFICKTSCDGPKFPRPGLEGGEQGGHFGPVWPGGRAAWPDGSD